MSTANINVRVDPTLKRDAEKLFSDLGMNISTAITIFLRSAVYNDGIPFEIKRPQMNSETLAALDEYNAMRQNPASYKRYASFDEALDEVLADA